MSVRDSTVYNRWMEFDGIGGNFKLVLPVVTTWQINEFCRWEQKQVPVINISKWCNEFQALCVVHIAYVELV